MDAVVSTILYWVSWVSLWAGLSLIIVVFADPVGYKGRRRKPARIVTATASVAAVISGWQPRITRIP